VRSVSTTHWIQKFFHFEILYCNGHATAENKVVSRWWSAIKSFRRFFDQSWSDSLLGQHRPEIGTAAWRCTHLFFCHPEREWGTSQSEFASRNVRSVVHIAMV